MKFTLVIMIKFPLLVLFACQLLAVILAPVSMEEPASGNSSPANAYVRQDLKAMHVKKVSSMVQIFHGVNAALLDTLVRTQMNLS